MSIRYSFIIPVKEINPFIEEAVPKILQIQRDDYEILIFPDVENPTYSWTKTRQIPTGPVGPAEKRDLALTHAVGEFFIFIDDDAFPTVNYLSILEKSFNDSKIVAVGGPAITPPVDSFWQRVSGAVFLSRLSGGFPERYHSIGQERFVEDWPSVNLVVRREAFALVGGFNSKYWPGEDTKLCLDLISKTKGKILYNPALIVWHHRREGLMRHLRQVGRYGLHRGFFAKKYPQTSLKPQYFVPSLMLGFVLLTPLLCILKPTKWAALLGWGVYLVALAKAFYDIVRIERNIWVAMCSLSYIFPTHLAYGYQFINGLLFIRHLNSQLRK